MPLDSYTLIDLVGLLVGIALMPLAFAPVGYLVAYWGDVLSFRSRPTSAQLAIVAVVGMSVSPMLQYGAGRMLGGSAALALPLVLVLPACLVRWTERHGRRIRPPSHGSIDGLAIAIAAVWPLLAFSRLIDLDDGTVLMSMAAFDYSSHTLVVDSIVRTGIPPTNPAFRAAGPVGLFYYYFWFLQCAVADWIGGELVSPRLAAAAGSRWVAVGLVALVCLAIEEVSRSTSQRIRRAQQRMAALLLWVSGADLLGVLVYGLGKGDWARDSDLWNELVSSWLNSSTYNLHHVAALTCWMLAFLVLLRSVRDPGRRSWTHGLPVAALALASAAGTSVWVTMVGAAGMCVWIGWLWARKTGPRIVVPVAASALGLVTSVPFILELISARQESRFPLALSARRFFLLDGRLDDLGVTSPWIVETSRLLALPVNYLLEFGLFALVGTLYVWRLRRLRRLGEADRMLLSIAATSLVICSVVRSTLVNNDLGWRGLLFAQMVTLLWTAQLIPPLLRCLRSRLVARRGGDLALAAALATSLLLGLSATAYDAVLHPLWRLEDFAEAHGDDQLARLRRLRQGYDFVNRCTPRDAVIQPNPAQQAVRYVQPLYGHRQVAVGNPEYGTQYGIAEQTYRSFQTDVRQVFRAGVGFEEVRAISERYAIDYLIVSDLDSAWSDRGGWVWNEAAIYDSPSLRVFATRSDARDETCLRCALDSPACAGATPRR